MKSYHVEGMMTKGTQICTSSIQMHFISRIIFICFVGSVDEKPTGREGWLYSWEVRVLEIWIAHGTPSLSIAISALVSCYDCWYQSCYHYPGWGLLFWAQGAHVELLEAAKPWSCSPYHSPYLQSVPAVHTWVPQGVPVPAIGSHSTLEDFIHNGHKAECSVF